ncbi:MAG: UpxY family transcription antiterminator [Sphingobacteriales bacterium]|nr:MAG: UpxY family transcription antiterminator [Sphingobacteriales bacterium]
MPWFVLYTKSRNEKKVARLLGLKGVTVYCPVKEEVRQWSDRRKKVSEPVFRSYVFVLLQNYKAESIVVLETPGTVRFLWWQGKPGIVRDEEINAIKNFLAMYKDVEVLVELRKGQTVTITEGPLKEKKGIILQVKGDKVYLRLESLGVDMIAKVQAQILANDKNN